MIVILRDEFGDNWVCYYLGMSFYRYILWSCELPRHTVQFTPDVNAYFCILQNLLEHVFSFKNILLKAI